MIKRHSDWAKRLREFEESRSATPFAWGTNDCCLFAADAVEAMTGFDIAADYRGYTTEQQALTKITMFGTLESMIESIARRFHLSEVKPQQAKRGDVALCFGNGKYALCVLGTDCYPRGSSERGIVAFPRGWMRRAWSVG